MKWLMVLLLVSCAEPNKGLNSYAVNCAACHQPDRRGMPGVYPDISHVQDVDKAIKQVLHGGKRMPSMKHLTDEEIAAILTFVTKIQVTPERIKDMR